MQLSTKIISISITSMYNVCHNYIFDNVHTNLVHDGVERVQCIDNSDVPELGVVWSSGDLD